MRQKCVRNATHTKKTVELEFNYKLRGSPTRPTLPALLPLPLKKKTTNFVTFFNVQSESRKQTAATTTTTTTTSKSRTGMTKLN